jgi:SAM-dependent methyltransferase
MAIIEKFNPNQYIQLIERTEIASLQNYILEEKEFISKCLRNGNRDLIDLGSGYGRLADLLINIGRQKVFIELNKLMYEALASKCSIDKNTRTILGDITTTDRFEFSNVENPVFLLCQNTLGVIEGQWIDVLNSVKETLKNDKREIIISFLKQAALKTEGIKIYGSLSSMLGFPNYKKTNFELGIYHANDDYQAKWWSDIEIEEIKRILSAVELDRVDGEIFTIIHLKF